MKSAWQLSVVLFLVGMITPNVYSESVTSPFDDCGTLFEGVELWCVLFDSEHFGVYLLDDYGGYEVGDSVRVIGDVDSSCVNFCMEGDGCIYVDSISWCGIAAISEIDPDRVDRLRFSAPSPNPFQHWTAIQYDLPQVLHVQLEIFDARGACVKELVRGVQQAGPHLITWDGLGQNKCVVPPGIYFIRFQAGDQVATRKVVLIR
jgi:hypothetical protein